MKAGEALIRLLERYDVDTVFGIPGTHSIELYRGLSNSRSIRHILPRHEQGAGFMADGYARVTGKPGVCFVITGPGVTNIATAVGEAYSDSVPLLVISPMNDVTASGEQLNEGRLHEIAGQELVTRPLTAFSETAESVEQIPELIERAFAVFESARPRPVHISIPLSVLGSECGADWQRAPRLVPPQADDLVLDSVVEMIRAATKPLIIAGGGCRHFGEVIVALAEKIPAPVINTVAGRGTLQGSHPLNCGSQLATMAAQDLLADSDLVLVLGSELAQTDHWLESLLLPAKQVWVNLDPDIPCSSNLGLHSGVDESLADIVCITADAQSAILSISAKLETPATAVSTETFQRIKPYRDRHGENFDAKQQRHWRVLTELRKKLPDDMIVCSDMTQLAYTAIDHLPLQMPNTWFHPNGFGTLGYALPAAIGVKCAEKNLGVLAIVGDAGLQYTISEMALAAELGLNIIVLLWQNDALEQIKDDMDGAGFEALAVTQVNPDFQVLAQGFGWQSEQVVGLSRLGPALQRAMDSSEPTLLELLESSV